VRGTGGAIGFGAVLGLGLGLGALVLGWVTARTPPLAPSTAPRAGGAADDLAALHARGLLPPIAGLDPRTLRDTFQDGRGQRSHDAIDILAPRGTPVLAVDDGVVLRLLTSTRGGLSVYQLDPTSTYCYYYAHLDGYAAGLREGQALGRGSVVGYVGTTGNAPPDTPHLHFAILRLDAGQRGCQGPAINPYPLWAEPAAVPSR
jgi:murein DD-endopeptidase MepM/ murein hydrolase activator NlpD